MQDKEYSAGEFTREYLQTHGPSTCYEVWKTWKDIPSVVKKKGSYRSFSRMWYILRQFGFIVVEREERPAKLSFGRVYYRIVDRFAFTSIWSNPIQVYNPLAVLGRKRYKLVKTWAKEQNVSMARMMYMKFPGSMEKIVNQLNEIVKISVDEVIENLEKYGNSLGKKKRRRRAGIGPPRPKRKKEAKKSAMQLWKEGKSFEDIAKELGISAETAFARVVNSMKKKGMSIEQIAEKFGTDVDTVEEILSEAKGVKVEEGAWIKNIITPPAAVEGSTVDVIVEADNLLGTRACVRGIISANETQLLDEVKVIAAKNSAAFRASFVMPDTDVTINATIEAGKAGCKDTVEVDSVMYIIKAIKQIEYQEIILMWDEKMNYRDLAKMISKDEVVVREALRHYLKERGMSEHIIEETLS